MIKQDSYTGGSVISVGDVPILDIRFDTKDMVVNIKVKEQDHFRTTIFMPYTPSPRSSFQVVFPSEEKSE